MLHVLQEWKRVSGGEGGMSICVNDGGALPLELNENVERIR